MTGGLNNKHLKKMAKVGEETKMAIVADPTKGVKVDAAVVAKPFREEIKAKVAAMKNDGIGTFFFFWF